MSCLTQEHGQRSTTLRLSHDGCDRGSEEAGVATAAAVAAGSEHALRISAALLVGQLDLTLVQCQPTYIHVVRVYAVD